MLGSLFLADITVAVLEQSKIGHEREGKRPLGDEHLGSVGEGLEPEDRAVEEDNLENDGDANGRVSSP